MEIDFTKVGHSMLCPEFQRGMLGKFKNEFEAKKDYWTRLEEKKGNHLVVKSRLLNMQELSGEFLVLPRYLERLFMLYLNKYHPSQQNKQVALNVARVYSLLTNQYFKSAEYFKMTASFYVSPRIWDDFLIGRNAKDNSIAVLQEMGVIIKPYRFNRSYHPLLSAENQSEPRIVIMYQFNLEMVKWLHDCVKAIKELEVVVGEERHEGRACDYDFDDVLDVMENEIWDYLDRIKKVI